MQEINEAQKKVAIPYEDWDDNWDSIFKATRNKKRDNAMKHHRKPKERKDD